MRILLSGHPETGAVWEPVADLMDERPQIWSLPGYGRPLPAGFEASKEGYYAWLVSEIEALGEPVHLVGHDWGGLLTARLASLRPDLLHSWVSDALGVFDPRHQWHPAAVVWQTEGQGEAAVEAALGGSEEQTVGAFGAMGMPEEQARVMHRRLDKLMWSCALQLYRSSTAIHEEWGPDLEGAAARPGLAIIAENELTERAWAERSAERAGAQVAFLQRLGHWWLLEDPSGAAEVLQHFAASVGQGERTS